MILFTLTLCIDKMPMIPKESRLGCYMDNCYTGKYFYTDHNTLYLALAFTV